MTPVHGSAGEGRTAWAFVAAQFALIGLVVLLPTADVWAVPDALGRACTLATWVGIAVMVTAGFGLGRGLTAAPLPNEHAQLRTGGLFHFVRHPIYSGLLLFTLAQVVASGSPYVAAAGLALIILVNAKARWEELRLAARFPAYPEYASRTPRFIPWSKR